MPTKPLHPCAKPGCPNLTSDYYCSEHTHLAKREDNRESAAKRGYDHRWRKVRIVALGRDPICPLCAAEGVIRVSEHVHHINRDPHDNRPENLLPMCETHHDQITMGNRRALELLERVLRERGLDNAHM